MEPKRCAIVNADGLVTAVIEAFEDYQAPEGFTAIFDESVGGSGWTWDGEKFSRPYEEPQPIPPPQIAKSVVTARLIAAGKIDAAVAAILSNPSAFARWVAPDKPVINADDPEAIAMISAIGADPVTILATE